MLSNKEEFELYVPCDQEILKVIREAVQENFGEYVVEICECPNLKGEEWMLSHEGLCGLSPVLVDVGDIHNLQQPSLHHVSYSLEEIAQESQCESDGVLLGAGAVAVKVTHKNGELVPNVNLTSKENASVAVILDENNQPVYMKYESLETGGLANLLVTSGKPGNVIKVFAKKRIGDKDFIETIREALSGFYSPQNKVVGLGGVFRVNSGTIKSHVMPGFCQSVLSREFMVTEWLQYFEVEAPLVCQSTILSDNWGTDCRLEHTHFMSKQQQGGHYHEDITPNTIEYEGYFVCCKKLMKIRNKLV